MKIPWLLPASHNNEEQVQSVYCKKMNFPIFYFNFMIWYFPVNFLCTNLIFEPPDWIWRHHLYHHHTDNNRKQCLQEKDDIKFPSHFLHFRPFFYQKVPSPCHINKDIRVPRLNLKHYCCHPCKNNNSKQGPGHAWLGFHSFYYSFYSSLLIYQFNLKVVPSLGWYL